MKGTVLTRAACSTSSYVPWATSTTTSQPIALPDHLRAERAQPLPLSRLRLLIAEVARHVVHDLELANAPGVNLLDPPELSIHELAALDRADERGLSRRLGGEGIRRREHACDAVGAGHEAIHEVEAANGMRVELARTGIALLAEWSVGSGAADDGAVGRVAQADGRHVSFAHAGGQVIARRARVSRPRGVGVHVHGDGAIDQRGHAGIDRLRALASHSRARVEEQGGARRPKRPAHERAPREARGGHRGRPLRPNAAHA
jgi:hypothetical protein